ncbi:GNAT family N-acetyltransferase [Roseibium denhamense]|uniref:L-ornithine N(alpha)-acyltransferase n=1 Tax=Roseibium denhamense TaxID=76305 RepID=A0ABY1PC17_9HYPH|nr:GNAT family N-acetyltransferase [Roseibium denhamense]MTI04182.1 GNAT family N-acetyltransferase [Roseibium denhamense]SMP30877.1 ornithine-acyl[acyl carrier protein] N-acyltransferase [Roseibium denhamense]
MRQSFFSPRKLVGKFVPVKGPAQPVAGKGHASSAVRTPVKTGETLGRIGTLEVRMARNLKEVRKAQRLRYQVFYEEMSAIADAATLSSRRDSDAFDAYCDHLLVVDHASLKRNKLGRLKPEIVGTYRVLRQDVANRNGGFYTSGEYDIQSLIDANPGKKFMELGRSCVLKPYRNKKTVELLWHGIWAYVLRHNIDVMLGCASIEGTNPDMIADQLAFLHHNARAPEEWRVRAVEDRYVEMNRKPAAEIDSKAALRALPPLVKGYLRLGAFIGDGAVVDSQFGTTDVLIIMPVSELNSRYVNYYGADASRYSS